MSIRKGNYIIAGNGGNSKYTGANGITIENGVISIKEDALNTNQINGLDDTLEAKQETLVSGSNIKTINGESILGEGNIDLSNILSNIDYVVESKTPTESDPSWYRVYKSGWIEQGGRVPSTANNLTVTNFSKEFKDTNYNIMVTCIDAEGYGFATSRTTKSAIIGVSGGNKYRDWRAVGQGKTL